MKTKIPKPLTLLFFIVLFDQVTKYLVQNLAAPIKLGIMEIVFVKNTGVSFGMFKGMNEVFTIVAFLALGFFIYLYWKEKDYKTQYIIICAGIIGNLLDRILLGYVVDFVNFYYFPIFNVADSAISIAVFWIIIKEFKLDMKLKKKLRKNKKSKKH